MIPAAANVATVTRLSANLLIPNLPASFDLSCNSLLCPIERHTLTTVETKEMFQNEMLPTTLEELHQRMEGHTPLRVNEAGVAEAAVSVLLSPNGSGDLELLLLKRAERRDDPWSGQISLPGGRRDTEDEDLLATAIRETREETGVVVTRDALVGELDDVYPRSELLPSIFARPFVFFHPLRARPTLGPEADLALWVTTSELRASERRDTVNAGGTLRTVTGYRIGPHFLWGLTERVLTPLLDLIGA